MTESYNLLVVEDDLDAAELLIDYLESENFNITYCETVTDALSYLDKFKYDIILLDLNLPDFHGFDVCKKIKKTPIIVVSAYSDLDVKLNAFDLGIDDYIVKPYDLRELKMRILAVIKRVHNDNILNNNIENNIFTIKLDEKVIFFKNKLLDLTSIEYKILSFLINKNNQIVHRVEFMNQLSLRNNSRSLDFHIKNIRKKIEDDTKSPQYLTTIYGEGYKLSF